MTASRVANSNPLVEGAPSWLESTLETVTLFFSCVAVQNPPPSARSKAFRSSAWHSIKPDMCSKTMQRQRSLDVLPVADLSAATIAGASDVSAGVTCLARTRIHRSTTTDGVCVWKGWTAETRWGGMG